MKVNKNMNMSLNMAVNISDQLMRPPTILSTSCCSLLFVFSRSIVWIFLLALLYRLCLSMLIHFFELLCYLFIVNVSGCVWCVILFGSFHTARCGSLVLEFTKVSYPSLRSSSSSSHLLSSEVRSSLGDDYGGDGDDYCGELQLGVGARAGPNTIGSTNMPLRMPEDLPSRMPEGMSEDVPVTTSENVQNRRSEICEKTDIKKYGNQICQKHPKQIQKGCQKICQVEHRNDCHIEC